MSIKRITFQFFTFVISAFVLISSTGFVADFHYCQGELKSFSLLGKAPSCHDSQMSGAKQCPFHKNLASKDMTKGCCENETKHFQSDEDQILCETAIEFDVAMDYFVIYQTKLLDLDLNKDDFTSTNIFYKPPSITLDIPIIHQSFLL